jgi:uncharacterized damage-inducible protein DinB
MVSAEQAKSLAMIFAGALENEFQTTKKVLAAIPEDQLEFKLGEKGRTARELAWHIVLSEIWFGGSILKGEFPMESEPAAPATKAEILAAYEQVPPLIEQVKGLSGEDLAKTLNFYNVFNLQAVFYLSFWNSHGIHHRGQLSTYLRAMNAHVPSIYGGSADEPFEMPAAAQA